MKQSFYGERDYASGQAMLSLRAAMGLTQASLATLLGVSRKAISRWEAGESYPKAEHLKALLELAVEQQAFPVDSKEEKIRAFWQAAHQKVLIDDTWLAALLAHQGISSASRPVSKTSSATSTLASSVHSSRPRMDRSDAPAITAFYGRERELSQLATWIVQERCRVVSILGLGGIGKSALASRAMQHVAEHFEVVIWRSLRDAPTCEALLGDCLQTIAPQALRDAAGSLERLLNLLLTSLRNTRTLLILDNMEVLLEEGQSTGHMRPGYEGYARLLHDLAQAEHQSCLLITSREKPDDLIPHEGSKTPVHVLRLMRLNTDSCKQLLAEKEVVGSAGEQERLIEAYTGNPLALKIVTQTILDLFDGYIAPFLEQGEIVFGGVRVLLSQQYDRLSAVEQTVLLWLAVVREPMSIEELLAMLGTPLPRIQILEAVEALRRRSLIEQGQRPGSFMLQAVVLEYVTTRLIAEVASEIKQQRPRHLIEQGLELAIAKEYVRLTQMRLIVAPLLVQLQSMYQGKAVVE